MSKNKSTNNPELDTSIVCNDKEFWLGKELINIIPNCSVNQLATLCHKKAITAYNSTFDPIIDSSELKGQHVFNATEMLPFLFEETSNDKLYLGISPLTLTEQHKKELESNQFNIDNSCYISLSGDKIVNLRIHNSHLDIPYYENIQYPHPNQQNIFYNPQLSNGLCFYLDLEEAEKKLAQQNLFTSKFQITLWYSNKKEYDENSEHFSKTKMIIASKNKQSSNKIVNKSLLKSLACYLKTLETKDGLSGFVDSTKELIEKHIPDMKLCSLKTEITNRYQSLILSGIVDKFIVDKFIKDKLFLTGFKLNLRPFKAIDSNKRFIVKTTRIQIDKLIKHKFNANRRLYSQLYQLYTNYESEILDIHEVSRKSKYAQFKSAITYFILLAFDNDLKLKSYHDFCENIKSEEIEVEIKWTQIDTQSCAEFVQPSWLKGISNLVVQTIYNDNTNFANICAQEDINDPKAYMAENSGFPANITNAKCRSYRAKHLKQFEDKKCNRDYFYFDYEMYKNLHAWDKNDGEARTEFKTAIQNIYFKYADYYCYNNTPLQLKKEDIDNNALEALKTIFSHIKELSGKGQRLENTNLELACVILTSKLNKETALEIYSCLDKDKLIPHKKNSTTQEDSSRNTRVNKLWNDAQLDLSDHLFSLFIGSIPQDNKTKDKSYKTLVKACKDDNIRETFRASLSDILLSKCNFDGKQSNYDILLKYNILIQS